MSLYALTEGPSQPEFNSFTPIGTSDMVDLASGDLNYNIPIMDVGGYPLNLAYNAGASMDQEASWVGLGWDMNVGQIARQMRGLPDDFNGDQMVYENNMKDNITVGANASVFLAAFGANEGSSNDAPGRLTGGIGVKYNNYDGFGFSISGGMTYQIGDNLKVGMQMESSNGEGVSASPSISFNNKNKDKINQDNVMSGSLGLNYNSRKGVENFTFSASRSKKIDKEKKMLGGDEKGQMKSGTADPSIGGSISFIDASFTPSKRAGMVSSNYMFNLNLEGEIWGIEPGAKFTGYYTKQGIDPSQKRTLDKGYGYENTHKASGNDVLDFNREKDKTVNRNTTTLPITNYTYDIYSVQGQGVSGMFRPYRNQVGFVYDKSIEDNSHGGALGLELGGGGGMHWGFDGTVTHAFSRTGLWASENPALSRFTDKSGTRLDYEKVYFKNVGGNHVDKDPQTFSNVGNYSPIKLGITGSKFSRRTTQEYNFSGATNTDIKRTHRVNRNQTIQKLTLSESKKYGYKTKASAYAKNHHTAEIRVTKEGGEKYVYGRALYNVVKKEVTFDVTGNTYNNKTGLVAYGGSDNTTNNNKSGDRYFNSITTPAYAHTYLLTSVLSADYQDLTGDGPTDDDLGTYTLFNYKKSDALFKWRVPFQANMANFDEGLKSLDKDNKGNYQYGEKELLYIDKIVTKTHIAIFETSERKDGFGVAGENGGIGYDSKVYKLNKIKLYSRPEYDALGDEATPIKTAHFIYDYSLCKNIDNNNDSQDLDSHEQPTILNPLTNESINNAGGKLTLKKVYFTYKDSQMGEHTPYKFNYPDETNYDYDMKAYDMWSNYKPTDSTVESGNNPTVGGMSNAEFAYVEQDKLNADKYTSAWNLGSIDLPSGGRITMEYESDDYSFVQNKKVMQMFKVVGAGENDTPSSSTTLFSPYGSRSKFLYIKVPEGTSQPEFIDKYINDIQNNEMYFRFLLNMNNQQSLVAGEGKYDYVTGYLKLGTRHKVFPNGYASIEIEDAKLGDGVNNSRPVNAISKAGWLFARQNLSRIAYGLGGSEDNKSVKAIVMEILGAFTGILDMFNSPNGTLEKKNIANHFVANKSWIRLMQPDGEKLGGGSRVKQIKLHDDWDVMTNHDGDANYHQFYGQQYTYKDIYGKSSGVATFEPLGGKENPFVKPFYDIANGSGLLLGGESQNYTEEPIGESFFPSPKITYSRIEVKNLPREEFDGATLVKQVKKHATGKVVTEFYTSKDYPTVVGMTPISSRYDKTPILFSILKLKAKQHLTMTQGYSVHTNDMDGKMKSQRVFGEGQTAVISGVDYNYSNKPYSDDGSGLLNNNVKTINSQGLVENKDVGIDYDVINDFRYNESFSETNGVKFNTAGLPLFLIFLIVPIPLPTHSSNEDKLKTSVTTKVVHTSGILRETVAYDLNSVVSTKNLAWDAETGNVLLTETVNEYNDNYYSFNYPAYWNYDYKSMGQSAKNLDLISKIEESSNGVFRLPSNFIEQEYLCNGDELWVIPDKNVNLRDPDVDFPTPFKAWVVNVENTKFNLITKEGLKVDDHTLKTGTFRVIRSGYRNNQFESMASVTSMTNPLTILTNVAGKYYLPQSLYNSDNANIYKIVNASAIEYSNIWPGQCECNLPKMRYTNSTNKDLLFEYNNTANSNDDPDVILERSYNPYVYNILGNWKPKRSYAYLTGRTSNLNGSSTNNPSPRTTGFFKNFHPFYILENGLWKITSDVEDKWQFASQVSQVNPYGQEIENKDALDRASSAMYGYNYRFPLAVASNSMYKEMGYDGFEDYIFSNCATSAHFNFMESLDENKITVSSNQAHTGRKSLRVAPKETAKFVKKIVTCTGTVSPTNTAPKNAKKTITKK